MRKLQSFCRNLSNFFSSPIWWSLLFVSLFIFCRPESFGSISFYGRFQLRLYAIYTTTLIVHPRASASARIYVCVCLGWWLMIIAAYKFLFISAKYVGNDYYYYRLRLRLWICIKMLDFSNRPFVGNTGRQKVKRASISHRCSQWADCFTALSISVRSAIFFVLFLSSNERSNFILWNDSTFSFYVHRMMRRLKFIIVIRYTIWYAIRHTCDSDAFSPRI